MANRGPKEDTKTRIIESAKKLFAEQGYQKTTIVDISRQAGLSEAALYEYFQGNEDLLLTIPDLWVSALLEDAKEQLFGIKGAENKLRKFLWWNMRRIEQAPLDAKVVYLFLKTNANFMKTEVYSNVRKLYATLLDIFEEGRSTGEMKQDLDPRLARDIFVGTMDHIVIRWLLKDMSYSLFDNLEEIFKLMVDAYRARPEGVLHESVQGMGPENGASAQAKPEVQKDQVMAL
ncbi:MAG: TetR/AcrR family transcriptional regulator [Desulfobacterales bacterium]|nr:TetR/AcrR family transcriptional regulator [Desulfobacterales bacterium]